MRAVRKAAVLVLLGLSLDASGVFGATVRSERPPRLAQTASRSAVQLWDLIRGVWIKAGCGTDPLGQCLPSSATQTQNTDAGCTIEPWGRCLPGH